MGCEGFFYYLLITISAALVTFNILVSSTAPLRSEFPGSVETENLASGFIDVDPIPKKPSDLWKLSTEDRRKRRFHTAVTATEDTYSTWQCRVMYYWFKKFQSQPGSDMGGFTRVLHSGNPDKYMEEIPTFVVDPLPAGTDQVKLL